MIDNKLIVENILSLLENRNIYDTIAIIANVLVRVGFEEIGVPPSSRAVDTHNIFRVVMHDRNTNGETLPNSMIMQGLLMLDWLSNRNKER